MSPYEVEANLRLHEAGFDKKSFSDLLLPQTQYAEMPDGSAVPYAVYGDRSKAKAFVFVPLTYSVGVEDPSEQVHFSAYQTVLGPDFCVVPIEYYNPKTARYSKADRKKMREGNWQPAADRILRVIETVDLRDDQDLIIYGYSLGGDIGIETTKQLIVNPQRGIRKIDALGAVDFARGEVHHGFGKLSVAAAFPRSGDDLYKNVLASNSPALLEARGIDLSDPNAEKQHDKRVTNGVIKYILADPLGNLYGFLGAANNKSVQQLNEISDHRKERPTTTAGRLLGSIICTEQSFQGLMHWSGLHRFTEAGDHAAGDKLPQAAGFILRTVANYQQN